MPPIGVFRSFVLDVTDLERAEEFWVAVLGWEVQFAGWDGRFTRIGRKGEPSVLLQRVPEMKTPLKNRAHIDVTVDDVAVSVAGVVALGGSVVSDPDLYPHDDPLLEWAVMADPFGNEFCLIREVAETL